MKITYTFSEIKSTILGYINDDTTLKKILKTNLNVLGKLRAILEAISNGLYNFIFSILINVNNNIFIDSADEEALIQHLADRGMAVWKEAAKATGTVRIGSTTLPTGTISISQLAVVGTEGDDSDEVKQFVLTEAGSIDASTAADSKGYYTIELAVESLYAGADYNVAAEAINQFITDIPGCDIVYNEEETSGGRDIETIDEVRERIKTNDTAAQQGSKSWFKSQTLEFSFVNDVVVTPRYSGRGTVGIAFRTASGTPTDAQKQEIADYFNDEDVDPAGAYNVVIFDMNEHKWTATIKVYWTDEEPLDDDLNAALQIYFDTLSRGEDIIPDQIETALIYYAGNIKSVEIETQSGYEVDEDSYPTLGTITWVKEEYAE